jgi:hypothetical protein
MELGRLPLRAGWEIKPHFVALVAVSAVGKSVVTSFHPVADQLQALAGIIVNLV